jgi:3-isopropylmalate dehydratase small subunit
MAIKGRVWKYGDNVNTDVIFPGKYTYTVSDPAEMAQYAMEDLDPRFAKEVKPGDVVVAGANFGCGSSREQAVTCLKMAGVGAIIGKSFARIYYRNCINNALPALTCAEAVDALKGGRRGGSRSANRRDSLGARNLCLSAAARHGDGDDGSRWTDPLHAEKARTGIASHQFIYEEKETGWPSTRSPGCPETAWATT